MNLYLCKRISSITKMNRSSIFVSIILVLLATLCHQAGEFFSYLLFLFGVSIILNVLQLDKWQCFACLTMKKVSVNTRRTYVKHPVCGLRVFVLMCACSCLCVRRVFVCVCVFVDACYAAFLLIQTHLR